MSVTQFAIRTVHRTYLAVDPATGALRHVANGPDGNRVLAHWQGEDACVLARRDGGRLSITGARAAVLIPCRLISDEDRSRVAFRPLQGALLTATPDGGIVNDQTQIADWELFTLEPDGGNPPAFSAALEDDSTFQHFCADPATDPATIAALLSILPAERRRGLLSGLDRRPDYGRIFPALRLALSGGRDRSPLDTRSQLQDGIEAHGWRIGEHTYGAPAIIDGQYGRLEIGRYCTIANDARIIVGNHPTDAVTTYPFAALNRYWPSAPNDQPDKGGEGVVIGNNVWVGQGVTILPGAHVGDGAILGAGAVVAKRVPPYAVAVGIPAKVTRTRFEKPIVLRLLALRWWDWPDEQVDRFIPLLLGKNIEAFLDRAEAAGGASPLPHDGRPGALPLDPVGGKRPRTRSP